ncbi:DUF4401 domain-containing protein [Psychrobacter aquimaris]|uniref:DUF4401 domain-containing protein n=1 Tax=Psychrobacter aquimaris TaxID=292733 RepID=UPI0018E04212|nr:DUF4401 domain-containing protein [Psychrobacter aquimaris]
MNSDKQTLIALKNLGLIDAKGGNIDMIDEHIATVDGDGRRQINDDHPWFLQLFFGVSGVLASLFFVGFLSLLLDSTGALDSMLALLIIGLSLNAAGFALFRNKQGGDNTFISSLAFAISTAGQAYIAFALLSNDLPQPLDAWLFLLVQGIMTFIVPNRVYRILGSLVTLSLMVYLLNYYHLPEVSLGLLALIAIVTNLQRDTLLQQTPTQWRAGSFDMIKAMGYASALMLLCVSVYFIAAEYGNSFNGYNAPFSYHYYLAQGLLILASLYAAYLILKRYRVTLLSTAAGIIVCAIIVLGITSVYVSGLLATSLIIIIAMANSQRALLGLAIIALVSYIFWYYYQLDTSLLIKSLSMLIVGLTMLMVRWLLIKRYFANSLINDTDLTISANDHQERLS